MEIHGTDRKRKCCMCVCVCERTRVYKSFLLHAGSCGHCQDSLANAITNGNSGEAGANRVTRIYKGPDLITVPLVLAWSPGMAKRLRDILWRVGGRSELSRLSGDLHCTFLLCHEIAGVTLLWEYSFWFPPLTCDATAKYFLHVCDHIFLQV